MNPLCLALLFLPSQGHAQLDPKRILADLQSREDKIKSLDLRVVTSVDGRLRSTVDYAFRRPNLERMVKKDRRGHAETTIGDGKYYYYAFSKPNDMRRYPLDTDLLHRPFAFELLIEPYNSLYDARRAFESLLDKQPVTVLEMVAVTSHEDHFQIYISKKTGLPVAVHITSSENREVQWDRYTNIKIDGEIPDSVFKPPKSKHIEIID